MGGGKGVAISAVCTMGTPECDSELCLFLRCLRTFHPTMQTIVGCTSAMIGTSGGSSKSFKEFGGDKQIRWVPCLDQYASIDRGAMERQRGVWYPSRHADFMMEKANLMEHAMAILNPGGGDFKKAVVAFLDCDVFLLDELPLLPFGTEVALSPHRIRPGDEALFGKYNGGFVIVSNQNVLYEWRRATHSSRFFDQASLESVAEKFSAKLYHLPPQHNYGYWRFFQSHRGGPEIEAKQFSIELVGPQRKRMLCYEGLPLGSIHTHLLAAQNPSARDVRVFNGLMLRWILKCARPMQRAMATAALGVECEKLGCNKHYEMCFGKEFFGRK